MYGYHGNECDPAVGMTLRANGGSDLDPYGQGASELKVRRMEKAVNSIPQARRSWLHQNGEYSFNIL